MIGRDYTMSACGADDADGPYVDNTNNDSINIRQSSVLSISGQGASDRGVSKNNNLRLSKINSLKISVNNHNNTFTKIMLSSKETAEKRGQLEAAFRFCKEAFLEMANTLKCLIEEGSSERIGNICKAAVRDVFEEIGIEETQRVVITRTYNANASTPKTFAMAVKTDAPKVHVSHDSSFEVPITTSFIILPDDKGTTEYVSSQATREKVSKILRLSDFALKVKKVTNVGKNGIKIEAIEPDIEKIKAHPRLVQAGLKVVENEKFNPRLIVFGVPSSLTADEIENDLIAQNLKGAYDKKREYIKLIYKFKPKENKQHTNCVIEVSPEIRKQLFTNRRIYLRFSACYFADYIRILQCYKCMAFGHLANDCKSRPICGHCSEPHQTRDCDRRGQPPVCCNCGRNSKGTVNAHSVL